ncbi:MAG: hypothetical protein BRC25_01400 [Parcubacteria group bacterium SW_6_46_9]|nr:MAG: hypothetical protein BRC25_01400 [Parcubacteria group bacterium SW_6_46_9]
MDSGNLESYLPSKRVLVFAGLLACGGVVYLFVSTGLLQLSDNGSQLTQGSDKKNAESSFLASQNPPESGSIADGEIATVTEEDNITERAANSVAPRALALAAAQENGEDISDQDIARVASSMSANINVSEPKTFTASDFDQYDTNDQESIQQYGKNVTEIIYNQASQGPQTPPPKILADYLQDKGNLDAINKHIDLNSSLVDKLQNITVPPQYLQAHIRLTEGFALAEISLRKIQQIDADPTVAVMGIRQYRQATDQVVSVSERLANQLSNDIDNL